MADEQQRREDDPLRRGVETRRQVAVDGDQVRNLLDEAAEQAARVPEELGALPWVPLGPRNLGGRVRALAADPRHPGRIYAGSAFGGVWRTDDGGDVWSSLDSFEPPAGGMRQALPVGAIAVSPLNPQILYVGTGEPVVLFGDPDWFYPGNGLYRSDDGGTSFRQIDHPETGTVAAPRFEVLLADPWEPERCWVACPTGLFVRELGGAFTQALVEPLDAPTAAGSRDASDVAVDFGDPAGPPPATVTVYVALRDRGIYRRTFDRAASRYTGAGWQKLTRGLPGNGIHRIKIALCRSRPRVLYAVFADGNDAASRVYRSDDGGDRWRDTGRRSGDDNNNQAFHNLVLEVHPENPDIVFFGAVDLFRTLNGGESWTKVLDSKRYDSLGDWAHHADQHALLFDPVDPRRVWVANDGGISVSPDLGGTWRKRSYGIQAAQLFDLTTDPVHPFLCGGGLYDNGTWVSLGGPSWLLVNGGDGGAMAFDLDPAKPLTLLSTWQEGVDKVDISTTASSDYTLVNPTPDLPARVRAASTALTSGIDGSHGPTFTGVLEHHPSRAHHALLGRLGAGYVTTDATSFRQLNLPAGSIVDGDEVTALAYAPSAPDDEWWLGTAGGKLFVTTNGSAPPEAWNARPLPGIAGRISQIAVHPTSSDLVAVAVVGSPARLYLSGDKGANWWDVSGNGPAPLASALTDSLGETVVLSVCFDPQSPAAGAQTLYAGTAAGIYVVRNAPPATAVSPPAATPAPEWRRFNREMPLILITDLAAFEERNLAGIVVRRALRCATFGRGAWECDLVATPRVRLLIRDTVFDDGWSHEGAAALANDPRVVPAVPLDPLQACDIRVDAPPFSFFEEVMDGAEFDQELASDRPVAGERNRVYVQVQNRGWGIALDVQVHLFWAAVPAGTPPAIPNLPAGFFANLAAPPAGDWQLVGPAVNLHLPSGEPGVAAFDWTVPVALRDQVALLALADHPDDAILGGPLVVADLVRDDRQAAVRVTDVDRFTPDVFIRDGIDDDGRAGSVSWGGRSPDIVVVQAVVANPAVDLRDLGDRRFGDKVQGGVDNHAYLRLHNHKSVPLDASVELFQAPLATVADHATWTRLGGAGPVTVPPKGWVFAPVITWTPADPEPGAPAEGKAYALVASVTLADDPGPDFTTMTDLKGVWQRLLSGQVSNNVALRVLPFQG